MDVRLGIIGAGAAAAAATYAVRKALPSLEVHVFEKSRGVCGRAAARRRDGLVYDYGANFLSDKEGRVSRLITTECSEGLVEIDGPIASFGTDGTVNQPTADDTRRWSYVDGITRLAKHLFAHAGVEVHRKTRIVNVRRPQTPNRPEG
ncbi:MAG: NAD(P)-binding protein [Salinivenus sp.]